MKQEILRIENMNVALGDVTVLTNLHLHLFSGELCCILAPSDGSKAGLAAVLSGQRPVNGTVFTAAAPLSVRFTVNIPAEKSAAACPSARSRSVRSARWTGFFRQLLLAEGRLFSHPKAVWPPFPIIQVCSVSPSLPPYRSHL